MSDDDDPTLTAEDVFGPPPAPGTTVTIRDLVRSPGSRPRQRFGSRSDGKRVPVGPRDDSETQLPKDYYSRD